MEESQNWDIASSLVKIGMRLTQVHALTGVCPNRLRHLHKTVNGQSAPPGRMPEYAHLLLKSREQAMEAANFLNYYNLLSKQGNGSTGYQAADPQVMLKAFKVYVKTTLAPMNINLAWYIIRDLGSGRLDARRCSGCGILYLFSHANEALQSCPMC